MRCSLVLVASAARVSALRPTPTRRAALGQAISSLVALPTAATAISGGGKDYAEATIKNQVFDGQKLDNKDFSGADAVDTSFKKASLRGARSSASTSSMRHCARCARYAHVTQFLYFCWKFNFPTLTKTGTG